MLTPRGGSSGSIPSTTLTQYRQPVGGSQSVNATISRVVSANYAEWYGWDMDQFYRRKRRKELLPMTDFGRYAVEVTGSGSLSQTQTSANPDINFWYSPTFCHGNVHVSKETLDAFVTSLSPDFGSLVQAAAARIYSSGHDTLTFVLELKKTILMFRNVGKSLRDLLQRGRIEDTWLQYRYGWRVLYYDIVQISEAIASLDSERTRYSERVGTTLSGTSTSSVFVDNLSLDYTVQTDIAWSLSMRGAVVADIKPPSFSFNPVITAWELIPYSFIVDWFLKVGQWLATMSFIVFSQDYVASYGYKLTYTKRSWTKNPITPSGWQTTSFGSDYTATHTLIARHPTSVPFRLSTSLNVPEASKILDLLSLIAQLARR